MKKRYLLTAEFVDSDFDLGCGGKRYWFKSNAIKAYESRLTRPQPRLWRYVLIDTKTNSVIRPLGETQESPRSPITTRVVRLLSRNLKSIGAGYGSNHKQP